MLDKLFNLGKNSKKIAVLLDPDKTKIEGLERLLLKIEKAKVDFIFIGGSLVYGYSVDLIIEKVKRYTNTPIILFPGSGLQLSDKADALLFLSLISGRNPEYLIGHQVMSAPYIKRLGIKSISTGYILVDSGVETTASYISNTKPIPHNKSQIAAITALAGEMLGMKLIYIDAGSGAQKPVLPDMITAVSKEVELPVIVGGGIKTIESIQRAFDSGANLVVVGTAIEDDDTMLDRIAMIKK